MEIRFSADVFEWRGPAPFFWLTIPDVGCDLIRAEATQATYGWGAIPVRVRLGATEWETSLLPKDGGYVLPLKNMVRKAEGVEVGETVAVEMSIAPRGGRQANGTGPTF